MSNLVTFEEKALPEDQCIEISDMNILHCNFDKELNLQKSPPVNSLKYKKFPLSLFIVLTCFYSNNGCKTHFFLQYADIEVNLRLCSRKVRADYSWQFVTLFQYYSAKTKSVSWYSSASCLAEFSFCYQTHNGPDSIVSYSRYELIFA